MIVIVPARLRGPTVRSKTSTVTSAAPSPCGRGATRTVRSSEALAAAAAVTYSRAFLCQQHRTGACLRAFS